MPLRIAGAVPGLAAADRRAATRADAHLHRPRHHGGGAGSACAAADGGRSDPHQAHRLRHFDRDRVARRRVSHHHPAGRAVGRPRIYRPRVRDLRARRHGQPAGHRDRRHAGRHRREPDRDVLRPVMGAGGVVRISAADAGGAAGRPVGALTVRTPHLPRHLPGRRRRRVRRRARARQRLYVLRRLCRAAIRRARRPPGTFSAAIAAM